jgi:hypothetical protein
LARRLGWTLAVAAVLMSVSMTLDLHGDPLPWLRLGLGTGGDLLVLAALADALLAWFRPADLRREARHLETCAGLSGEPLSGALALLPNAPAGTSRWMASRSLALAAVAATTLDLRRLAPVRRVLPALAAAGLAILALAGVVAADPAAGAAFARAVLPWRDLPAPGAELLLAEPGDCWLAPGASLEVSAHAPPVQLQVELAEGGGEVASRRLVREGSRHRLVVGPLFRDLRWRLHGPGLVSRWHQARIAAAPRVEAVAVLVRPPTWTGLPDERIAGGDAVLPPDSEVQLTVWLSGPRALAGALVTPDGELPLRLEDEDDGRQRGSLVLRPQADTPWRLRLIVRAGEGGIAVEPPQRWLLQVRSDQPPTVQASVESNVVAPGRAVRVVVAGSDDIGLAALWVEVAGPRGDPVRVSLPVPTSARRAEAAALIVPRDLGVVAGDRLVLVPAARDRAGVEARGAAVELLIAGSQQAASHVLAADLARLHERAVILAADATEAERGWKAVARAWRPEDPTAGTGGLRSAGAASAAVAQQLAGLGDDAAGLAARDKSPPNLDAIALRAAAAATGAHLVAARAAQVGGGATGVLDEVVQAFLPVARTAGNLAGSLSIASGTATLASALATAGTAADDLAGAAAVLAAERAWQRPTWRAGLAGRFWRGGQPGEGEPLLRLQEVPGNQSRDLPVLGRNDWCARWEGEVLLPEAGRWTIRCTSDDGVRLRLAGQEVLPQGSWVHQAATPWESSVELAAGWHAVEVLYFQGGGDGHLTVAFGAPGRSPTAVPLERWRHRGPPPPDLAKAMAALPAGAVPAAAHRARQASGAMAIAVASAQQALGEMVLAQRQAEAAAAAQAALASELATLIRTSAWDDPEAVAAAGLGAARVVHQLDLLHRLLREMCRNDARGTDADGLAERLRRAAAKPGQDDAKRLARELVGERERLAVLVTSDAVPAASRAAALAALWTIDDAVLALLGRDEAAARAAAESAAAPLALVARHQRALRASAALAAGPAGQAAALRTLAEGDPALQASGGDPAAVLAAMAEPPGWPADLLRLARDRLRALSELLRHGGDVVQALSVISEAAEAVEIEALRPGRRALPPTAIDQLGLALESPSAETCAAAADALGDVETAEDVLADRQVLFRAAEQRRRSAIESFVSSTEALVASLPVLQAGGQAELAARASALTDQAHVLSANPEASAVRKLASQLLGGVATPLAEAIANGTVEPGGDLARAGRIAAQAAADATYLAEVLAAMPSPAVADELSAALDSGWARGHDPDLSGAATSAEEFPEDERAAIRAYLRLLGEER